MGGRPAALTRGHSMAADHPGAMPEIEEPLEGGNAAAAVVRSGATVRKPWQPCTGSVHRFMAHLREQGLGEAPEPRGRDAPGRQVVEFVPGIPAPNDRPLPGDALREIGRRIRRIHDVAETFQVSPEKTWNTLIPVESPELVCHNDLAPWNLVKGRQPAFIDWEGAGPSTRLWDLAYAAQSFAFFNDGQDPGEAASRLRVLVIEGYDAAAGLRAALPRAMGAHTQAMHDFLRESHRGDAQPWGRMSVDGHGEHWARATRFVKEPESLWVQALRRHPGSGVSARTYRPMGSSSASSASRLARARSSHNSRPRSLEYSDPPANNPRRIAARPRAKSASGTWAYSRRTAAA